MKRLRRNRKGQFTIIAAVFVAVILVAAVMTTYATIRYDTTQSQTQVLSAIDEINLALKQVLGFTVGYYGSVLQVTGNTTYARILASNYLQSGLTNIGDIRPEWGPSFNITALILRTNWFTNESSSSGSFSVTYDLTGIGVYGMTYSASSRLEVQTLESSSSQAQLKISKDNNEPLVKLSKQSLHFYRYNNLDSLWELVTPNNEPLVYADGTYIVDIPSGVDPHSYIVKIEDGRGIIVIASSFSSYTGTLVPNAYIAPDFVDNSDSDIDSSPDKGTQSNFAAQQSQPDSTYDGLAEASIGGGLLNVTLINAESFEGTWPPAGWSEDPVNNNWNREGDRKYDQTSSADFDGSGSGNLVTSNLDCSDAAAIYVDFWYYDQGCDNNEFVLYYYNGQSWVLMMQLGNGAENTWIHYQHKIEEAQFLQSQFRTRFTASPNQSSEHAYIDLVTIRKETSLANYQIDIEEQWTNVNYTYPNQDLCIKAGSIGSETLMIDAWSGSNWLNIGTLDGLSNGWKNISVASYLTSSTFTIRFRGSNEIGDTIRDSWNIDAVLLGSHSTLDFLSSQTDSTIAVEWLQNGTMRWIGQNLELTTLEKPIPPIAVRGLHLNQTINGVNQEVPFQIEDWTSEYRIPAGLTNNATVYSNRQMIVFLLNNNVSKFTLWWNGSDEAIQTSLAYTNKYFNSDSPQPSSGSLTNGRIRLQFGSFSVTSTIVSTSTSSTANFMRINGENSIYGAGLAYVIHHGVVRDVIQQEAEWSDGAVNCPNLYANIVITLPANVTYYTYQLRIMFINSTQSRAITDLCPIRLTASPSSPQAMTEDGIASGVPSVTNGTGTFYNYTTGSWTAHHWAQLIAGAKGAGIMFTDDANQKLYAFDSTAGSAVGALKVDASSKTIELQPVASNSVSFKNALDITWHGAVVTFDNTPPIYAASGGSLSGLWVLAEYPPTITVIAES